MITQAEKGRIFSGLHEKGTFILPNFWDAGSALLLEHLGFQAMATTSAGFAQAIGRLDGEVSLDEKLDHCRKIARVTRIPISTDFENGFADKPETAAANLLLLAETGVVGASIEDWSGKEIYDHTLAVDRIQACAEVVATFDIPFMLTGRAENLLRGVPDLDDTINRLQAYAAAGADVLYAPGLTSIEQIETVINAVEKPINVLFVSMPDMTFSEYETLGVRRISIGGALANHAIGATLGAARRMLEEGDFTWARDTAPRAVIQQIFADSSGSGSTR